MNQNIKNKIFQFSILYSLFFIPTTTFAAFGGVNDLLTSFGRLVTSAIPIAFGLAVLFFFYGIAMYVLRAGDQKAATEGKSIMIYGVIAIFVMSSIWGLVTFIGKELNITTPPVSGSGGGAPGLNGNDLFGTHSGGA